MDQVNSAIVNKMIGTIHTAQWHECTFLSTETLLSYDSLGWYLILHYITCQTKLALKLAEKYFCDFFLFFFQCEYEGHWKNKVFFMFLFKTFLIQLPIWKYAYAFLIRVSVLWILIYIISYTYLLKVIKLCILDLGLVFG